MAADLVVIGGGEHARVVIDAALAQPSTWNVLGFADPAPGEDTIRQLGVKRVGGDEEAIRLAASGASLLIGVGALDVSDVRARIAERFGPVRWATLIHPRAWVSPSATVEPGAVVLAGACVNTGARIGAHAIVNTGAIIEHDVVVGAFAQVGPGAVAGGGSSIGAGAFLGLGCRIRDHVTIGGRALVGMGAVVVSAVPEGARVVGVPARGK